jgi:hypothetical protein
MSKRIAIFFKEYEPLHMNKDPGLILKGLIELGHECEIVTLAKDTIDSLQSDLVTVVSEANLLDEKYWKKFDVVIAYTWLRPKYHDILLCIKAAGVPCIVKADTDGRLGYPLNPRWDTFMPGSTSWSNFPKIIRRRLKRRYNIDRGIDMLMMQIKAVSAVVVETPQALSNITTILYKNNHLELLPKFYQISNPAIIKYNQNCTKKKKILAIGDWKRIFGNYYQKNTHALTKSICSFLTIRTDYTAKIIGNGSELVTELIENGSHEPALRDRLTIYGSLDHDCILSELADSRTLFVPSIFEGLSIACTEALGANCSIVGSPLEGLEHQVNGGRSGILAHSFRNEDYVTALLADALRWDQDAYAMHNIAQSAMTENSPATIANQYVRVIENIMK